MKFALLLSTILSILIGCGSNQPIDNVSALNQELNASSSPSASDDTTKCTTERQGQVMFVSSTNTLTACVNKNWVVIPQGLQGPPGAQGMSGADGVCSCNVADAGPPDSGNCTCSLGGALGDITGVCGETTICGTDGQYWFCNPPLSPPDHHGWSPVGGSCYPPSN